MHAAEPIFPRIESCAARASSQSGSATRTAHCDRTGSGQSKEDGRAEQERRSKSKRGGDHSTHKRSESIRTCPDKEIGAVDAAEEDIRSEALPKRTSQDIPDAECEIAERDHCRSNEGAGSQAEEELGDTGDEEGTGEGSSGSEAATNASCREAPEHRPHPSGNEQEREAKRAEPENILGIEDKDRKPCGVDDGENRDRAEEKAQRRVGNNKADPLANVRAQRRWNALRAEAPANGRKDERRERERSASRINGTATAMPKRSPPIGGPTNSLATPVVASSRPFASSSRSPGTSAGTSEVDAFANSVSAEPRRKAAAYSAGSPTASTSTATASAATAAARVASTAIMTVRRSSRSTSTPAGIPKMSQGTAKAKVSAATAVGSRVSVAARSGKAASAMPSPTFEIALAAQTLAKGLLTHPRMTARPAV